MARLSHKQMQDYNYKLFAHIIEQFPKNKKLKVTYKSSCMCIEIKNFTCYLKITVDDRVNVYSILTTVGCQNTETKYTYFDFSKDYECVNVNLTSYRAKTIAVFKYLISEALNMPYAPEHRANMTPSNATKEEIDKYGWSRCWEGRYLEEHNYDEIDVLIAWIEKCVSPKMERERKVG